jgi:thioester reductase-like protein
MRTILLTGASGVIGRALAEELREHRVIGLVHADGEPLALPEVLRGDLAAPRFGLTEERWRRLAGEVDVIVHSGALTVWGQPRERYEAINLGGTRTVIELARLSGAPVHQVGTCFVHAIERGELDKLGPGNVVRPYIWSKLESDRMLADSGVPHSVYRPTNLVGHSVTGASHRPQIVQSMSDWFCRGKAPFFPAHRGNLVDVIPLDVTVRAIASAVLADDLGQTYWLTYGPDAMTVADAQDILIEHARAGGRELDAVHIVDPRLPLPVPLDQVPATSRVFLKVLIDVSEVTHASGGVLPTSLPELRERYGIPLPSDRVAYRRSLEYWAGQRVSRRDVAA